MVLLIADPFFFKQFYLIYFINCLFIQIIILLYLFIWGLSIGGSNYSATSQKNRTWGDKTLLRNYNTIYNLVIMVVIVFTEDIYRSCNNFKPVYNQVDR